MDLHFALAIARIQIESGFSLEKAVNHAPPEHKKEIRRILDEESVTTFIEPQVFTDSAGASDDWLNKQDRNDWYYWPRMRAHLLEKQGWTLDRFRSLDDATDKILKNLWPLSLNDNFDVRGLVLGHVQSGKTGNYTALLAKAADVGCRLFIVLAGLHKGLRMQTQRRLQRDLTGYGSNSPSLAISYPESGKRWIWLTGDDLEDDFHHGTTDTAVFQGNQLVIMVVKKNGAVLRRLKRFLQDGPEDIRNRPMLMIDDEADVALDTRGTGGTEDDPGYEKPTVINGLTRNILHQFNRSAYIAYTATPFANILIPSDLEDPQHGRDLYPRDFIVSLPEPAGYFGTERLFGKADENPEEEDDLDIVRIISQDDYEALGEGRQEELPDSIKDALLDFVLAGAARACRGDGADPATMLIHTSRKIDEQKILKQAIQSVFDDIRDKWRYARQEDSDLKDRLEQRWRDFKEVTERSSLNTKPIPFDELLKEITRFMEAVQILVVNSDSEDILDYAREPGLKAVVVGGNKLSRGLTLEGLLISYYARDSDFYDTLLQMGRWFGYREGYADLTRIYTTQAIFDKFRIIAQAERQLRQDIVRYEREKVTPKELGMRILAHPSMKVTNPLKMRHARRMRMSYSGQRIQTFRFPLDDEKELAGQCEKNLQVVRKFTKQLIDYKEGEDLIWRKVPAGIIIDFLKEFENPLFEHKEDICSYIKRKVQDNELTEWIVFVNQLKEPDKEFGNVDWGNGVKPNQISRTRRVKESNSLGAIVDPKDEMKCLPNDLKSKAEELKNENENLSQTEAARKSLLAENGILILYPISKYSKPAEGSKTRKAIYEKPDGPLSRDLIGIALSFSYSPNDKPEEYVHTDWKSER